MDLSEFSAASNEPANYKRSYKMRKEIAHIEITLYQSASGKTSNRYRYPENKFLINNVHDILCKIPRMSSDLSLALFSPTDYWTQPMLQIAGRAEDKVIGIA
jgi:hypothetical protein